MNMESANIEISPTTTKDICLSMCRRSVDRQLKALMSLNAVIHARLVYDMNRPNGYKEADDVLIRPANLSTVPQILHRT